jgi:hypothetical protein
MGINKIKKAAEIAKSKTSDKRWIAAIDKAVAGVESGWWIITELAHGVAVTTECGNTYFANGNCQYNAFQNGQPCKHRAMARLVEIAREIPEETAPGAVSFAEDVAASSRENLIAEITNIWPRVETTPLAVAPMVRFGVNSLNFLDDDMLRRVRLAVAM